MNQFLQDVRYGLRMLAKNPGFTAVAVLTLALGIGANTAIYSILHAVLLRPVAVEEPEQLVAVTNDVMSYPAYTDFRDQNNVFSGFAVFGRRQMSLSAEGRSSLGSLELISGNYFSVLGVHAAVGRPLTPSDDRNDAPAVVVLSHGFWTRQFASDAQIIGKIVSINAHPFQVVGVGPTGFRGATLANEPDVWISLANWPLVATGSLARLKLDQRGWGWLRAFGRLKPGVSIAQAEAALNVLAKRQEREFPRGTPRNFSVSLHPLVAAAAGMGGRSDLMRFLALLAAVVGIALLIACANVGNLLLARAAGRTKEIGTRLALGASRGRIIRQLLAESLLIAGLGALAGLVVAAWAIDLLGAFQLPGGISVAALDTGPSAPVLLFTLLLLLLVVVLFGLAPALQSSRPDLVACLKDQPGNPAGRSFLRAAFLVVQVSLCLTLLVAAGLFVKSLRNAFATDPGFRVENVAVASINLGLRRYDEPRAQEFYRQLTARVRSLPGVESASWVRSVPVSPDIDYYSFAAEGYQPQPGERMRVNTNFVGTGYFATMQIPIVAGRAFQDSDAPGALRVVVINEAMARRYWPGQNPVGRRITMQGDAEVIGVAKDSKYLSLRESPEPHVYVPLAQSLGFAGLSAISIVVRTVGDPRAIFPALRSEAAALDPDVPLFHVETLRDHIGDLLAAQRLGARVLGFFSLMALVLAVVGTYGVVAVYAGQRKRELGVRMALGAARRDIVGLVLGRVLLPAGLGVFLGSVAAFFLTRALGSFLYGVSATDPMTFAAAAFVLAAGALAAGAVPAFRAAKVDPMIALRYE